MKHVRILSSLGLLLALAGYAQTTTNSATNAITRAMVEDAQHLIDLHFSESKIDLMLPGLKSQRDDFEALHQFPLSNSVVPAILFNPLPVGFKLQKGKNYFKASEAGKVRLP